MTWAYRCPDVDCNRGGSIREPMLVQRPSYTHLSRSSTPGGKRPLARDDDNALVTQAVLFAGNKAALAILGAGVVVGAAAVKAAQHFKSGPITLKSKLSRRAAETTGIESPVPLTVVAGVEREQPDAPFVGGRADSRSVGDVDR